LISFTSGSTGKPKTIVRSHGFLAHQNACVADLLKPQREDEVDLVAFPVFVLANLGLGVTSVLPNWNLRHHDAADAGSIARHADTHHVTRALIPPSICEKLAQGPAIRLDAVFTGGGPVFPDLLERLAARMPRADIVSVYGSTEAEPIAHQHVGDIGADDWRTMKGGGGLLAGAPIRDIQLKILDDEIVVTGDHVNKGYLDQADDRTTKLALDGTTWHRTGDAGRVDETGRLWLLGRLDGRAGDLLPFGVEAAARFWPNVRQAALVAIDGRPVLAIAGDGGSRDLWQREADRIGALRVVAVKSIPLDRRHRSKIDYAALRKLLGSPE
jgi:acyl-CoA synthetase (AMP-forming)/AMP-acid ligase II